MTEIRKVPCLINLSPTTLEKLAAAEREINALITEEARHRIDTAFLTGEKP
jgi:hypothetical protein